MLTFAFSVFLLIVTPGPGVLSTAGFGAAYGFNKSLRYVFGLFLGTNLVFFAVATGLIAILLSLPSLRIFLLILSTCYLFYLASKIALAGSKISFIKAKSPPGIISGPGIAENDGMASISDIFFYLFWTILGNGRVPNSQLFSKKSTSDSLRPKRSVENDPILILSL